MSKILVTVALDFEGKGLNGNTTENEAKLKSLLQDQWNLPLGYHYNDKDSLKIKGSKIVSVGVFDVINSSVLNYV